VQTSTNEGSEDRERTCPAGDDEDDDGKRQAAHDWHLGNEDTRSIREPRLQRPCHGCEGWNVAGIGPQGSALVGPLIVTPQSGDLAGIAVAARTSAPGATGRFGLFYSGIPNGMASSGSVWLHGLLQNAENRTNLAIVNTGEVDSSSDRFRIEIYSGSSGSLVTTIDDFTVTMCISKHYFCSIRYCGQLPARARW
jgi:hypothetical protein